MLEGMTVLFLLTACSFTNLIILHIQWRPTKVETTGATLNYETLISRLFETFLDFETKKQVVPRHAGTPQKGALDYNIYGVVKY